nr:putative sodium:proton antiporter [uncultured bacterium]
MVAGPITGWVEPDALLGDLLFPAVSLGVGILLFEGGLALRRTEIAEVGPAVARLVLIGALFTWIFGSIAVSLLFDIKTSHALLIASILVVSGPTVVLPLLRLVNVRPTSAAMLKWEGILIDPVGALLAVIVLEAVLGSNELVSILTRIVLTLGVGGAIGYGAQRALTEALSRHWIPDRLHNAVVLMSVVTAFVLAEQVQSEGGLMATTAMGVAMANQSRTPVGHIVSFQEDLGVLVLGALFILLGARVDLDALVEYLPRSLALLALLVLVGRPLAVWLSTIGTSVPRNDRMFLASMAPRGIVAAAVASLFALELDHEGTEIPQLVPVVFTIIIGSVVIYSISAGTMARLSKVARAEATGVALVGGAPWVLDMAEALTELDVPVLVITAEEDEIEAAISRGLFVYSGRLESEDLVIAAEGVGVGTALALSDRADRNDLAKLRFVELIGRANVFVLPSGNHEESHSSTHSHAEGRRPFGPETTYNTIEAELAAGSLIRSFTYEPRAYRRWMPLMVVEGQGFARVAAQDEHLDEGETIIGLVGGRFI